MWCDLAIVHGREPDFGKQYMNLTIPRGGLFSPIVLEASEQRTVVARVANIAGKRDVELIVRNGSRWQVIGKEGHGITGMDHTFLNDARQGPDGRYWVLVSYSRGKTTETQNRVLLYTYDHSEWKRVGPPDGHAAAAVRDHGIHFLGDSKPVHHFEGLEQVGNDKSTASVSYLLELDGNSWRPTGAQELLRRHPNGFLSWRQRDGWFFAVQENNGTRMLQAYWLKGPRMADVVGPTEIAELGI
jgi:hypothetical protein